MIPVNIPLLEGNEKKYLDECIDTGWISSEGPFVKRFENELAEKVSRKHGIAVSSGTAALECAMLALQLEEGSEVIMPAFTIISCATAIIKARCIPVLVDSDAITWNMDVSRVEEKITARTKAIMVVHIYGLPVDMNPIQQLAKKYDLKIIEDAAEQHGQFYTGQPIGSFGDVSVFSFYANKNITTGEGGMILTNDGKIAEHCRSLRNLCFVPEKRFVHHEIGSNYRMTNIQAALGVAQLEYLEKIVEKKRAIGKYYDEALQGIDGIQLPLKTTSYASNIYWVFGIVLEEHIQSNADEIMMKLSSFGIGTRPFFYPMHKQPVFTNMGLFKNETHPVAERLSERGFYLPSGAGTSFDQLGFVADKLREIITTL